ncbi:MAG: Ig-like domain-containing protein [Burkholderiaceae bacterium]|nr:Ig-like domain-containing protein [Burkholderiaceae bacterium]
MKMALNRLMGKLAAPLALLAGAALLSACGGGNPGSTGGGTSAAAVSGGQIMLTLENQNGTAANLVSGAATLTLRAKVVDKAGAPIAGAVVKFSSGDATLVGVSPGSDITDANGVAVATVAAANQAAAGATTLTAVSVVGSAAASTTLTGSTNVKVGVAAQASPTAIELVSYLPADRSILIKGTVGAGRSQTAQVTFKVTGNGQPIANQKVRFEFQPTNADLTFSNASGVTGQGGEVTAIVNSGTTVTVAAVKVTVLDAAGATTGISATSDQISVTNDTTSVSGVSLSTDRFYLEALNVDGRESNIMARLTDKQGGQVTNGTVVTFTTDGGAITGLNNSAMCQTVDGVCSVKLVGQNPRPAGGIATVVASVTVDGAIKQVPIRILMSGSQARFTGDFNVDAGTNCDPQTILFNLTDINGNAMPEESKLTVISPKNASATLGQDTVLYNFSLTGGTTHQIDLLPGGATACVADGARTVTGSVIIVLTTPHGAMSTQTATITFRAK